MQHKNKGFHLLEVLATVAIISIVAVLSFPLYTQYIVQARRLEAETTLSRLALAMEQFRIKNNTYSNVTLSDLHFGNTTAKNNYQLAIQNATDHDYLLAAIPLGKQAERDSTCGTLTLRANDDKGASGTDNASECW